MEELEGRNIRDRLRCNLPPLSGPPFNGPLFNDPRLSGPEFDPAFAPAPCGWTVVAMLLLATETTAAFGEGLFGHDIIVSLVV